ncbi:MAG: hypothetical protein ABW208_02215 [Pyrinomonadaceae bacterium]
MTWVRLTTAAIVFVTSCAGLGYLAELRVLRRKWPGWASGLLSAGLAFVWPVIVAGYVIYDARRYQAQHPDDDAPGMLVMSVIVVGVPVLALLGAPLVRLGAVLARSNNAKRALR